MIHAQHRSALATWVAMLLFPILAPAAEPFTAKVVRVKDGDSLVVLHNNKQIEIRLGGIDCPESGQAFGQKAKQAAFKMTFDKVATVTDSFRSGGKSS